MDVIRKSLAATLLVAVLLVPIFAHAAVVSFNFEGVVSGLAPGLTDDFVIGDSIVGSYKVDDETFNATDLMVTVGGDYIVTANTGHVSVVPGIWFLVSFSAGSGITGDPLDGESPVYFDIQLDDPNNVLESGVLPLAYPISEFGWDRSNFNFESTSGDRLSFEISSISAVPLPTAFWLFGSGLIGLIGVAKRKKV